MQVIGIHKQKYHNQAAPFWYPFMMPVGENLSAETVVFVCPNYHHSKIDKPIKVSDDGMVTPDIHCTEPNCNFWGHIQLLGYGKKNQEGGRLEG
jgi:hypothetical protein